MFLISVTRLMGYVLPVRTYRANHTMVYNAKIPSCFCNLVKTGVGELCQYESRKCSYEGGE